MLLEIPTRPARPKRVEPAAKTLREWMKRRRTESPERPERM